MFFVGRHVVSSWLRLQRHRNLIKHVATALSARYTLSWVCSSTWFSKSAPSPPKRQSGETTVFGASCIDPLNNKTGQHGAIAQGDGLQSRRAANTRSLIAVLKIATNLVGRNARLLHAREQHQRELPLSALAASIDGPVETAAKQRYHVESVSALDARHCGKFNTARRKDELEEARGSRNDRCKYGTAPLVDEAGCHTVLD